MPPDAQLPLVLVNGELVSSGGKLSMPVIRHQLDALGVQQCDQAEIQVALKTIIGPTCGMSLAALQMVRSPYPLRSCA
ncbi:MAG: hypothetical protein M5U34_09895 [Chloroflexi bacterium]|nr:hypothetical protein [Chloroflexota bacterium]